MFGCGGGRCHGRRNRAAKDRSDLIDYGAKVVVDGCDGGKIRFSAWDVARQDLNPDGEKTRRRRKRIDGNTLYLTGMVHRDNREPEGQKRNAGRIFTVHHVLD